MLQRFQRTIVFNLCILVGIVVCASADSTSTSPTSKTAHKKKPSTHHAASSSKTSSHGKRGKSRKASHVRGQQKIDPQRARNIQEALIRNHYMSGEPTGTWDANSQKAMEKFQADNGWQSKVIPDSRALIKLGLGPDQQHLLNPESAMTTPPQTHPAASTTHSPVVNSPSTTETSSPN